MEESKERTNAQREGKEMEESEEGRKEGRKGAIKKQLVELENLKIQIEIYWVLLPLKMRTLR